MRINEGFVSHTGDFVDLHNMWHRVVATYDNESVCTYVDRTLIYAKDQSGSVDRGTDTAYIA